MQRNQRSPGHSSIRAAQDACCLPRGRRALQEIFDLIEPGHDLVEETFAKLIERGELVAYTYDGFFGPMDTIKDRQRLETLDESGAAPWRSVATGGRIPTPDVG